MNFNQLARQCCLITGFVLNFWTKPWKPSVTRIHIVDGYNSQYVWEFDYQDTNLNYINNHIMEYNHRQIITVMIVSLDYHYD